jgi:hypothetical protein
MLMLNVDIELSILKKFHQRKSAKKMKSREIFLNQLIYFNINENKIIQ